MKCKSMMMGKRVSLFGMLCLVLMPLLASAETAQEKGLKVMQAVDALPVLEKMISETLLHIYDAQNQKLFSKKSRSAIYMENFRTHDARLRRSISYFFSPADDRGNGALMVEVADGDDDQWIYLKGLRKPKRVVGADKSSSFMGSDFSNGDVAARDIDDSTYTWLATEKAVAVYVSPNGKEKKLSLEVEKIQAVFKEQTLRDDYGYSKTIAWINVQTGLPLKVDYYNLGGQLAKTSQLATFTIRKNEDGQKIYIPTEMEMKNVMKGTRTVMQMKRIKTGSGVEKVTPEIFHVDYLTRKWW